MNYYIQGDAAKAEQIKAAFEKKGYKTGDAAFNDKDLYYATFHGDVYIIATDCLCYEFFNRLVELGDYTELKLPIEPCFKVGDKIEATTYGIKRRVTIREVDKTNRCYFGTLEECIGFSEQDQWHLAPKPHYDIKNFHVGMPVLVREYDTCHWQWVQYSHFNGVGLFFAAGKTWRQCIPFNDDTKHLLGTTDMCDEQYINW